MPPKKKKCAPPSSVRQSSENQDDVDLLDESSDSKIDDDPVSLLHSLSTMSVIANYIFPIKLFSGINFLFCNPE